MCIVAEYPVPNSYKDEITLNLMRYTTECYP